MTCKDELEAKQIARFLLEEKLIACANILGSISSLYEWEGDICEDNECGMILKSCASRYEEIESRIKKIHSYKIPCIIQLPIERGNEAFLSWISQQAEAN